MTHDGMATQGRRSVVCQRMSSSTANIAAQQQLQLDIHHTSSPTSETPVISDPLSLTISLTISTFPSVVPPSGHPRP
jgi:hypothetical protein